MNEGRLATLAVVAEVVKLGEQKLSRVGHTLIQKLVYLLQEEMGVRLGYEFKLHLHGPYAADLWGDLTQLRDYGVLTIASEPSGYGYRITPGSEFDSLVGRQRHRVDAVRPHLERLLALLGGSPVQRLEILATAHLVAKNLKRQGRTADADSVAAGVVSLKPHLTMGDVVEGYKDLAKAGLVS